MRDDIPYCYCIVRADLSHAQQIVQSAHSCLEAGKQFEHADHTHLVALKVKNEDRLLRAALELQAAGVKYACFFEPDGNVGYTAIATEMIVGDKRRIFEKYPLI